MNRLVDRFGRTGFAALTSLIWALPMAAWAGSADLSPIDQTAYPWIALAIGLVMLAVWIALLSRFGKALDPGGDCVLHGADRLVERSRDRGLGSPGDSPRSRQGRPRAAGRRAR